MSTTTTNNSDKEAATTRELPDPKIIDLIRQHQEEQGSESGDSHDRRPMISLEFFPPRTPEGVQNLHKRMDRMLVDVKPLFTDITWGAGGSTADLSLQLALYAHTTGHVANLHMTCTNIMMSHQRPSNDSTTMPMKDDPKVYLKKQLQVAYDGGIRNIVALRGDPPAGQDEWTAAEGSDFTCALDLVTFIRHEFGDKFGIAVAGYPEGHPNRISLIPPDEVASLTPTEQARASTDQDGRVYVCKDDDYIKEMNYLKQKVDAGADFIITQMFFDVNVYKTFVQDCRDKYNITCPIVPGLMCINAYPGFVKMTKFCKTRVPSELQQKMDELGSTATTNKDQAAAAAVKQFGMTFGAKQCQEILEFDRTTVLHFYTLNLEKVVCGILDRLGLTKSGNLSLQAKEVDASTQVAVGSAWARVGDVVHSTYGSGVVMEIRNDGTTVVEMDQWVLAGGQKARAYLQQGTFEKKLPPVDDAVVGRNAAPWASVGDVVQSIYGSGIVMEIRKDGTTVVEMNEWVLAGGQKARAYLCQQGSFHKK